MTDIQTIATNYILPIIGFYLVAYLVHKSSGRISKQFKPLGHLTMRKNPRRIERQKTLQSLISSSITIVAFSIATLLSMSLFVSIESMFVNKWITK